MSGVSVSSWAAASITVASPIAPICQVTPSPMASRNRCDMFSTRDVAGAMIVARHFITVRASDRTSPAVTVVARNMIVASSPLLVEFARVAEHVADEFNVDASTVRSSVAIMNSTLPPPLPRLPVRRPKPKVRHGLG